MSDWNVHLVSIGKFGNHPNADTLSITQVYGSPVIFKRDTYKPGDLAVFIPPDSCMPTDPESVLLKDNPHMKPGQRVDAIRLRGIFSNGFLVPAHVLFTPEELQTMEVGTHVAERLGITKYEDAGDQLSTRGENERDGSGMPHYTDIKGWPTFRNSNTIKLGEEVVLTEKIHGANARFCYKGDRLWCGSRTNIKAQAPGIDGSERSLWWKVAKDINLEEKMKAAIASFTGYDLTGTVVFGEVYGQVQDLKYGVASGASFRVFDTWNPNLNHYNDWDVTVAIASAMGLELVPVLFRGPYAPELEELRNGPSVLYPGHIREGYVIKPVEERWSEEWSDGKRGFSGRTIFKFVGEDYKLRKQKQK